MAPKYLSEFRAKLAPKFCLVELRGFISPLPMTNQKYRKIPEITVRGALREAWGTLREPWNLVHWEPQMA